MKRIGSTLTKILFMGLFIMSFSMSVYAAPKTMPDGHKFDAEFYANTYADVKDAFGTNEEKLYNHYLEFGKYEGRLPYAGAKVKAKLNDIVIQNGDGSEAQLKAYQQEYSNLPAYVKYYFNQHNINITNNQTVTLRKNPHAASKSVGLTLSYKSGLNEILLGEPVKKVTSKEILLHELGHAFNSTKDFPSDNWSGWEEVKKYDKAYASDSDEAFAVAFEAFYRDTARLKRKAPNAYKYMLNWDNEIKHFVVE